MQEERKNQEEIKSQEENRMEQELKGQNGKGVQPGKGIRSKNVDFLHFINTESQALNVNGYNVRLRMIAPEAAKTFANTLYTLFGPEVSKNLVEAYATVDEGGKDDIYYRAIIILYRNLPGTAPTQVIDELNICCEHPEIHIY